MRGALGVVLYLATGCGGVPYGRWNEAQTSLLNPSSRALNRATPTGMAQETWTRGPNSDHGTVETSLYYDPGIPGIRCYELRMTLTTVPENETQTRYGMACAGPANRWGLSFNLASGERAARVRCGARLRWP